MRAALVLVVLVACGGKASPAAGAEPSCRDLAVRGDALIAAAPADQREATLRFVAEVVDLCQSPGLAARARTCLAAATDLASARACPSLPATGEDIGDPNRAEAPSCADVVAHALALADRPPDGPLPPDQRADEELSYGRDCADTTAEGRRCAMAAETVDDIDECFGAHSLDEDGTAPAVKDPFAP